MINNISEAITELSKTPFSSIELQLEGEIYFLNEKKVEVSVKNQKYTYDELYLLNSNNEEVFNREIEILNDTVLYDLYKTKNNLVTTLEFLKILNSYKSILDDFLATRTSKEQKFIKSFCTGTIQNKEQNRLLLSIIEALKTYTK